MDLTPEILLQIMEKIADSKPDHECDYEGPWKNYETSDGCSVGTSTCSKCGSEAFHRSMRY